jgi:ubiquinone/menaquinone biosynthesis C-methylase UbiE
VSEPAIVGNLYDKFGSKNPLAKLLMRGFLRSVSGFAARTAPASVLEVGCGEGHLISHLQSNLPRASRFCACDLSLERLAPEHSKAIEFKEGSAYRLPYEDQSFDLVVCCEVLEHLEHPELALVELYRVSKRYVLLSTPREPLWRLLNLLRLSYVSRLGNTPGHIQHFSRRTLTTLLETEGRLLDVALPIPWIVVLTERRDTPKTARLHPTR